MKTRAIACQTAQEAIEKAAAMPGHAAILLDGKRLVVTEAEARRLAAAGTGFAYLCNHKGAVVTVPVNG